MKIPSFMKTIRFRLTLWYVSFLVLVVIALLIGLNLKMGQSISVSPQSTNPESQQPSNQTSTVVDNFNLDLRNYSIIGVAAVIVVGAIGSYFLSGAMLKPIGEVILLARRSSYSNLKGRLNYTGPNDEIKRLADTFDNMLNRLNAAVDSQKQFIQDASHELRTPIATAMTNIEVLEMNSEASIEDYRELTNVLKLSLDRINNISNSLQLLSGDSNYTANWTKVIIKEVVTEVVNESEIEARRLGVDINWNEPSDEAAIIGDSYGIKQVIFNLVDNAVKYNHPGGSVNITIRNESKSIIVQISDTGDGIAAEDLPRIFDRFFRVDKSRSRQRGGSGLGLAIVKKIVEDHHGSVSVDSIPGLGSTFSVEFPIYPSN